MSFTFKSDTLKDHDFRLLSSSRSSSQSGALPCSALGCRLVSAEEHRRLSIKRQVHELKEDVDLLELRLSTLRNYRKCTIRQPFLRRIGAHTLRFGLPAVWKGSYERRDSVVEDPFRDPTPNSPQSSTVVGSSRPSSSSWQSSSTGFSSTASPRTASLSSSSAKERSPSLNHTIAASSIYSTDEAGDNPALTAQEAEPQTWQGLVSKMSRVSKTTEDCLMDYLRAPTPMSSPRDSGVAFNEKASESGSERRNSGQRSEDCATVLENGCVTEEPQVHAVEGDQPGRCSGLTRSWSLKYSLRKCRKAGKE